MTQAGIQISSVRKYLQTPAGVLESFRKVSAMGYRLIQIQWIAPEVPSEVIRDALQETGLTCVGTQDYTDVVLGQWEQVLAQNALWGGRYVCLSGIPEKYQTEEGCQAFAAELNRLSESLDERGLILNFHPRAADVLWFGKKNSLELLLEHTRPPFQFCLDVYHLVKAGLEPVDWIRRVRGRNDLIHFKDRLVQADGSQVLTPVGQGGIDWKPVFQACAETGVKAGFAEQESWQKDAFECLQESYEYMVENGVER